MVSYTFLLAIIWLHVLSDFFLQTDKMAVNKSKSIKWLSIHIAVYSSVFLIFGWEYALVNGALHFATDFVTSRITSYFWKKEQRHWFFVTIGVDQAIHMTSLVLTYPLVKSL